MKLFRLSESWEDEFRKPPIIILVLASLVFLIYLTVAFFGDLLLDQFFKFVGRAL
jgi:hypothetical protein